ncbi:MAG TPA: coenzyme F420-0:L-glutamate ligase [Candidatus Paceibacterota bacterium]|nr:coenzyme F420-0:L-glutamate ligase [Candidatus Paceibacterota bacterium]
MALRLGSLFRTKASTQEMRQEYAKTREKTGFSIVYDPQPDGEVVIRAIAVSGPAIEATFKQTSIDEAHILYMEATELLRSRAEIGQDSEIIRTVVERLFALFRGEKPVGEETSAPIAEPKQAVGEYAANPGKRIEIEVDGVSYLRLPIKTRLITMRDTDILPIVDEYVRPHLQKGDIVFVSEKALTITQGRVVDMSDIHPTPFARFLARHVGNYYGTDDFHGFGHGTDLAMQLFIEEAGYLRIFFAAAVSAITRPFGIRGLFYRICGLRAKSIDCPMSFLILEYAHSVKLAPNDPDGAACAIRKLLGGHETVILDANYRGAFSLGKSTRSISESFIGKLFRDNPLGQSDEMTPFCIVRKAATTRKDANFF